MKTSTVLTVGLRVSTLVLHPNMAELHGEIVRELDDEFYEVLFDGDQEVTRMAGEDLRPVEG